MRKAFIFTLDALFAVGLLSTFLIVVSFDLNTPKETHWLATTGNTFMTSLDKNGVFYKVFTSQCGPDSQAQTTLNNYLSKLPPTISASMTVKLYQGSVSTFTDRGTISASKGTLTENEKTVVKEVFSRVSGSCFGIAELVLSYG